MPSIFKISAFSLLISVNAANAHYVRKPLETMAYANPHPSKIFNHPATGMKHRDNSDSVAVVSGTPRAYQRLGPSLFYGPYFYTPRDRD